jgi:glycogen debranching enzyme
MNGGKCEFYTYSALNFTCKNALNLAFSFSENKNDAKKTAEHVLDMRIDYVNSMAKYMNHAYQNKNLYANCAMKALDDLLMHVKHVKDLDSKNQSVNSSKNIARQSGLFAGLPWFFQYWSRDELISLKAFMLEGKNYQAKETLLYYASLVGEDGLLPNRVPHSDVKSIDSVGWLFVRISNMFDWLSKKAHSKKHSVLKK